MLPWFLIKSSNLTKVDIGGGGGGVKGKGTKGLKENATSQSMLSWNINILHKFGSTPNKTELLALQLNALIYKSHTWQQIIF